MSDTIDLLQIKIDKARAELPPDTRKAIDSFDWRKSLLELRSKKGYTFEQLGDLELETELMLCGIVNPENYPRELSARMKLSRASTDELVNEMNDLVFKKIREELIKITEQKTPPSAPSSEIKVTRPEVPKTAFVANSDVPKQEVHPILVQKLSTTVQIPTVRTEHTLENITKKASVPQSYQLKADPYREIPE